ncbi:MAG: putative phosphothreonine lyase domain-containing protein [Syntrophorhabdales bacterium]|jgi:hypothetical protein
MMKSGRKASVDPSEPRPSQVTDKYWLYAERKNGDYPAATPNSGKWLIFAPISQIDEVWIRIKHATEHGRLGDSAKVATAKPNPNASDPVTKVICVYTYDWTDKADVSRIRDELRALGIVSKIPYKADRDTLTGRYARRGHKRISKYYE